MRRPRPSQADSRRRQAPPLLVLACGTRRGNDAKHYDVHRRPPPALAPGQRVYARTSTLGTSPCATTTRSAANASALPRYTGVFDIVEGLSSNTIVIAVPESISKTKLKRINVKDIKLADMDADLYAPGPIGEPLFADFIVDDAILEGTDHTSLYVK